MNKRMECVLFVITAISVILMGCTQVSGNTGRIQDVAPIQPVEYNGNAQESPYVMTQQIGWWGGLDALRYRLPADPLTVDTTGAYGGVLRLPFTIEQRMSVASSVPYAETAYMEPTTILREQVIEWNEETQAFLPNLFVRWDRSEDGMTYTFAIREGVRWSDGTPLTVRDVQFALEDIWAYIPTISLAVQNDEYDTMRVWSPVWQYNGQYDGELPRFEQMNDYTFSITYSQPDDGLVQRMALARSGYLDILIPFSFFKGIHPNYTNGLEKAMKNMDDLCVEPASWRMRIGWVMNQRMVTFQANRAFQPMIPMLGAWVPDKSGTIREADVTTQLSYYRADLLNHVRNPYYWKVDAEGKQLPYIDELQFHCNDSSANSASYDNTDFNTTVGYGQVVLTNSEFRYWRLWSTPVWARSLYPFDFPAYRDIKDTSGRFYLDGITDGVGLGLVLDYDLMNDTWRKAVQDIRFRRALSLALDREQLITMLDCTAVPATLGMEYDPERARALLEECGYELVISLSPMPQAILPGVYQDDLFVWLAESWQAVGLNIRLTGIDESYTQGMVSAVRLAWLPEPKHEYPLTDYRLDVEWETWALVGESAVSPPDDAQTFLIARDAWRHRGGSYGAYTDAIKETQCYLPLLESIVTPASTKSGLAGVTGETLPEVWKGVAYWYWEE